MCAPLPPSARLQSSHLTDRTLLSAHVLHSPYGQYDALLAYCFSSAVPPIALNTPPPTFCIFGDTHVLN